MKIAPAMLLCGVALILATPVLADRIESKNDSRTANFFAESTPRATFNERFEPKFTFDAHDRTTPIVLSAFSSSFYGTQFSDIRFSTAEFNRFHPTDFESRELAFIFSRGERGRHERNSNNAIPSIQGPVDRDRCGERPRGRLAPAPASRACRHRHLDAPPQAGKRHALERSSVQAVAFQRRCRAGISGLGSLIDSTGVLKSDLPALLNYNSSVPTIRTRGRLPHWEHDHAIYFVTFRLADSLPKSVLRELELERKNILIGGGLASI